MIIFDESTGKFRDAKTGRLRSDVSGLLSSKARRQFKNFAGNVDVAEYRRKLGQRFYKPAENISKKKKAKVKAKPIKNRPIFVETNISKFESYINDWLENFNFVLDEEDTDMETP